jgi:hypothetical protein
MAEVRSTMTRPQRQSRYQVRAAAAPAWAADDKGTLYRFDGLRFTRCRRRDDVFSLVPAWQTPCFGWLSLSECPLPAVNLTTTRVRPAPKGEPHLAA